MEDPSGEVQSVYPLLYADVADHPEGCKVGSFDTSFTQRIASKSCRRQGTKPG